MYAVANIKGEQFKLEKNHSFLVPKLNLKEGENLNIDKILLYQDDKEILIGKPFLEKIKIQGKILDPLSKGKKIIVFKYKKRKRYRRKRGHRQIYTKILIEDIIKKEVKNGS